MPPPPWTAHLDHASWWKAMANCRPHGHAHLDARRWLLIWSGGGSTGTTAGIVAGTGAAGRGWKLFGDLSGAGASSGAAAGPGLAGSSLLGRRAAASDAAARGRWQTGRLQPHRGGGVVGREAAAQAAAALQCGGRRRRGRAGANRCPAAVHWVGGRRGRRLPATRLALPGLPAPPGESIFAGRQIARGQLLCRCCIQVVFTQCPEGTPPPPPPDCWGALDRTLPAGVVQIRSPR